MAREHLHDAFAQARAGDHELPARIQRGGRREHVFCVLERGALAERHEREAEQGKQGYPGFERTPAQPRDHPRMVAVSPGRYEIVGDQLLPVILSTRSMSTLSKVPWRRRFTLSRSTFSHSACSPAGMSTIVIFLEIRA
jgi:hypothetical protein